MVNVIGATATFSRQAIALSRVSTATGFSLSDRENW